MAIVAWLLQEVFGNGNRSIQGHDRDYQIVVMFYRAD